MSEVGGINSASDIVPSDWTAAEELDHSRAEREEVEQKHEREMQFQKEKEKALPPASSPLHVARKYREAILERKPIYPDHPYFHLLHTAVKANDINLVHALLELAEMDLNMTDDDGRTAFHWAALHGRVEITEMLVSDLRLDTDIRDKVCIVKSHCTSNQLLIGWKILRHLAAYRMELLHLAAMRNHVDISGILLADPEPLPVVCSPMECPLILSLMFCRNRGRECSETEFVLPGSAHTNSKQKA